MSNPQNQQTRSPPDSVSARWEEKHALRSFESEIRRQEDILFGVALYFEGIQFLYYGQESVTETYRKELRNTIQLGKQSIEQATQLLEAVRRTPSRARELQEFRFQPCQGATRPSQLADRAEILFKTYGEVFSRRSRAAPLTEEELVRLLNAAAEKIDLSPSTGL